MESLAEINYRMETGKVKSRPTVYKGIESQEVADAALKMEVIWETHPDALLIVACEQAWVYVACLRGGSWEGWHERWAA